MSNDDDYVYEDHEDYEGDYIECPDCGGEMEWCNVCDMYTQICCIDYGTCWCS